MGKYLQVHLYVYKLSISSRVNFIYSNYADQFLL